MTARYLLCPGLVRSRVDGQVHHIGADQLARLYGVSMAECLVMPLQRPEHHYIRTALLNLVRQGELIALHPRYDGAYTLPQPAPGGSRQPTTTT